MARRSPGIVALLLSLFYVVTPPQTLAADPADVDAPAADTCADAPVIGDGSFTGDTTGAESDGAASCDSADTSPDVWFRYVAPVEGTVLARIVNATYNSVVSVHTSCPGTTSNEIVCDYDGTSELSAVTFDTVADEEVLIRVAGSLVTAGSFTLEVGPGGTVSGTVIAASTGEPLAGATIVIWDELGGSVASTTTNAVGEYVAGLSPGTYFASAALDGFLDELYEETPCRDVHSDCHPPLGTPIHVPPGMAAAGIDFTLDRGGVIAGKVTQAVTGDPLAGIEIEIWDAGGMRVTSGDTSDAFGDYAVGRLVPGTYFVTTRNFSGFLDELYDDLPCPDGGFGCNPTAGTPVMAALGTVTSGIDFALQPLGVISGTVTQSATGQPLERVRVRIWSAEDGVVTSGLTDEIGRYVAEGLFPGTYFATTYSFSLYQDELYDDVPCTDGVFFDCDRTTATPIAVELAAITSGVDFGLELAKGIAGTVTDEVTGAPVPGVFVDVWSSGGDGILRTVSGTGGRYNFGLEAGVYFVSTDNRLGAVDEFYDDVPCPDGPASDRLCDVFSGTPVVVRPFAVTRDVDFALAGVPCLATQTALCLNQGRFRVQVAWEGSGGNREAGRAVELTSDTGYFWFFDPGNVELVVKLLDGCFDPFDRFWFFAAGLTNVAVEITVTDTVTGAVKKYVNPLGSAFEPIIDTAAFATCDAMAGRPVLAELHSQVATLATVKEASCMPGAGGLCLNDARFLVEAFWRTPEGQTGDGRAVALTEDSGYFWFFSPDNVEVVAKVLDACHLEPYRSFWVFAAGLTNVEVTLRVTDTGTGAVQEYKNPLGRPFRPVLDTRAFATCPE